MTLVDALISKAVQTRQPISGTFELTARCNLSCRMCYIHSAAHDPFLKDRELSTEQWIDIAAQAAAEGTLLLLLTGGEPMLRPDFCRIYRACAERGFLLTVNTNGTLLTDEIFALFQEHPPLRLNVSLYGFSEEIYESLCGNGSAFIRAKNNLTRLRELGISVQISFSATPLNAHALPQVVDFANQIGAQIQHTAYMFPPTRKDCQNCFDRFSPEEAGRSTVEYLRLRRSPEEFAAVCKSMLQNAPPRMDGCGELSDSVRCRAGKAAYWVTFDGKMLPCGMIPSLGTPIESFSGAWRNTVDAFAGIKVPKDCASCGHYSRCDICPAICYAENRDFSVVPEYICRKNQAYREMLTKFTEETENKQCD